MLSKLKKDEVIDVLKERGEMLRECSMEQKKDFDIVNIAILDIGFAIIYADTSLWYNKEILETVTKKSRKKITLNQKIPPEIAIAKLFIENYPNLYKTLPQEIRDDKQVTLTALNFEPSNYEFINTKFFNDKDIAFVLVKYGEDMLNLFSDSIKDNFDIVERSVSSYPMSLQYASERLKMIKKLSELL